MMVKPKLWLNGGVWRCCAIGSVVDDARQQSGLIVAGKGETPEAAYESWLRKEFLRVIRSGLRTWSSND